MEPRYFVIPNCTGSTKSTKSIALQSAGQPYFLHLIMIVRFIIAGDSRKKRAAQPPPPLTAIKWDLDRFPILRISFKNYMSTMDRAVQEQVATECAMVSIKRPCHAGF